jgi:hypothetical protein
MGTPSGYFASHRQSKESADDKGRDDQSSRDELRSGMPWSLLQYRLFAVYDHNVLLDSGLYSQRRMVKSAFSAIKYRYGFSV